MGSMMMRISGDRGGAWPRSGEERGGVTGVAQTVAGVVSELVGEHAHPPLGKARGAVRVRACAAAFDLLTPTGDLGHTRTALSVADGGETVGDRPEAADA